MSADGGSAGPSSDRTATSRDGRTGRPRVQQLRPTNKTVTSASDGTAAGSPNGAHVPPAGLSAGSAMQTGSSANAAASGQQQRQGAPAARVIPRIVTGQGSGSTIIVNTCQKGNPVLKAIKNVGWEYGDIVPDYQVGVASCALFLSLRYHQLHPEYIHSRIEKLGNMYSLRILLIHCDVKQPERTIKELTKVSLIKNLTIMVAWSNEEVASYLERYKSFENKAPDMIRERVNDDYMSHLSSALTSIRGVNKTDVVTLATNFGSLNRIAQAGADELSQCPGFGEIKVRRVREVFEQPFRVGETRTSRERREERERLHGRDAALEKEDRRPVVTGHLTTSTTALPTHFRRPALAPFDAGIDEGDATPAPITDAAVRASATAQKRILDNGAEVEDEIQDADEFGDDLLDGLTEEEQLQLALEMSRSGGHDA